MKKSKSKYQPLSSISRRDFVGGSLVGVGSVLLNASAPVKAATGKPVDPTISDPWTGFAGVGDYAKSNGNIAAVREAAHLVRDGFAGPMKAKAISTDEVYDMVIIGGGFSGIGAAYAFNKKYGDSKRCLVLENHPVFGGEAKQNEFDVDGYRIYGPQGSNAFVPPAKDGTDLMAEIYRAVGLPFDYKFVAADPGKTTVKTPLDSYESMFKGERVFDKGYFVEGNNQSRWVVNPWQDQLARMPWSGEFKADLTRACKVRSLKSGNAFDRWLDSMSYKDYLEKELKLNPAVTAFADPLVATSFWGVGADAISAYGVSKTGNPGFVTQTLEEGRNWLSFPGGNTSIFRYIVKHLMPDSIKGGHKFEEILNNPIDFAALDRPTNALNLRLNATAIDLSHEGDADTAEYVNISYYQQGQVKQLKAKTAVVSTGGWIARNIVSDMPPSIAQAYKEFRHGPVLVVNVALTNWRFLNRLGISSGRWFKGFGSFFSIRRPMDTGASTQPFDPDKPTVMTFYVPFIKAGYPADIQGAMGRAELLSKSYRDYESEIVMQMTTMFSGAGFDARRDIAGIVLNRWGHALLAAQPGFYFGKNGQSSPMDIVKQGYGRIQFGHSELSGFMGHTTALAEGVRASEKLMAMI